MATFIVRDGEFICDDCGRPEGEHDMKVDVDGPLRGHTHYICREAEVA